MAKIPMERPAMQKPEGNGPDKSARLTNVRKNRTRTSSENPKTVRMTALEKKLCADLAEEIQDLTTKTITESTVLRAAIYLAREVGPERMLEVIKENI